MSAYDPPFLERSSHSRNEHDERHKSPYLSPQHGETGVAKECADQRERNQGATILALETRPLLPRRVEGDRYAAELVGDEGTKLWYGPDVMHD